MTAPTGGESESELVRHFKSLASFIKQEDLEKYANKSLADLLTRDGDRHRGWKISFYCFLVMTIVAMLLAVALSITAGWELHPVNMEVVRWTWGSFFGGGIGALYSRAKQFAR